jgi:hypothetical protein
MEPAQGAVFSGKRAAPIERPGGAALHCLPVTDTRGDGSVHLEAPQLDGRPIAVVKVQKRAAQDEGGR